MDAGERVEKLLQLRGAVGGFRALEHFPVADFQRVRDLAGQAEFRAGELRVKIVERPCVVRLEAHVGLDVVQRQPVGLRNLQVQFAVSHGDAVNLQPSVQRGGIVQSQLDLLRQKNRAAGLSKLAEKDIVRDDSTDGA